MHRIVREASQLSHSQHMSQVVVMEPIIALAVAVFQEQPVVGRDFIGFIVFAIIVSVPAVNTVDSIILCRL